MKTKNKKIFYIFLLVIILILAFAVRIYNIENVPAGIYPDEAENGVDAYTATQTKNYKMFYEGNNGREGLYINLQAMGINLLGTSMLSLKLWSIIFGTLTVLGTFLLSKEIFRSWRAGLITSFLFAFSFWAINFSRIGFRAIMLPAILSFSFYFIIRGIRTKKLWQFALGGLIFGLGLHTYIAFRIAPAILFILFLGLLLTKRHLFKNYWKQAIIFIIFMMISAGPMLYSFYTHPEFLDSRSASISIMSPDVNKGNLPATFAKSFGLSLAKYNFWGDPNWRHNYPPYPALNPLVGISFAIGLIYLLSKFFHFAWLRWKKNIRDRKFFIYAFILVWFFSMLAPEFMTAEGLPHALRSIGTLPVVYIIATFPIVWLIGYTDKLKKKNKIAIYVLLIFGLLFTGTFNTIKYHVFWANNPMQHKSFDKYLKEISDITKNMPSTTEKYIVADQYTSQPIKFLNSEVKNMIYVWDVHVPYIEPKSDNFVIFVTHPNEKIYNQIKSKFPQIKKYEHKKAAGGYYLKMKLQ